MSPDVVTIHSSWRGLLGAVLSPFLLVVAGGGAALVREPHPIALTVLGLGTVIGLGVLADFPRRTDVGPSGLVRRCFLRRHAMAWDTIDALGRARGSRVARARRDRIEFGGELPVTVFGGLIVERGRRRYLLADRVESRKEYDALRAAVEEWAPEVVISADPPPVSAPPTDLYRRKARGERRTSDR